MKLQHPFIQLPVTFDAPALALELDGIAQSEWRPHPQGFPGNSALPLISVNGNADDDGFAGPMRSTGYLDRLPYLKQVLGELGAVWGRTRLMRLSGQAEVSPHVDQGHYWSERMRVHVPIVTQPGVRFYCGDAEINMAAGECWIFDTWRLHRVLNDGDKERIHLVADTVGGEGLWNLLDRGRPHHGRRDGWVSRHVPPRADAAPALEFESRNTPAVMTPWELRHHLGFLFGEARPHPALPRLHDAAFRLLRRWSALWAAHGEDAAGRPRYRAAMDEFMDELRRHGTGVLLHNDVRFLGAFAAMAGKASLGGAEAYGAANEGAPVPAPVPRATGGRDPWFDRPIVVVSPPRSGSTLLFETLARVPGLFTVGGESHGLMEGLPGMHPSSSGWHSNRVAADLATPDLVHALRERFAAALRDREGRAPAALPVRFLEKTPKNSLRIPFLREVLPEARFVYLYRDPRQVLSSMLEAWQSGRFCTYPRLPQWTGLPWSLLLVPGWRELIGKPLHEIVAAQWSAATRLMLDDLAALPPERVSVVRYDELVADPQATMQALCACLELDWDQDLGGELPESRHTVSRPEAEKWRRHAAEIEAVWPALQAMAERARAFAQR